MLKSLTLENFRGFSEHRIEFSPETILIGQNNAGKTTAIEALRVLSVCQSKVKNASFAACPPWLDGFCKGAGFRVSLETIDFDFTNVQHSYNSESPALLKAKNSNNTEVHVYIGNSPEQVFCQVRLSQSKIVHSKADAVAKNFGKIKVMPPIGSLLAHEKLIAKDRLSRYLDGYLSYRHFRNQLWERQGDYRLFKKLLEDTWPGLSIQHFENDHGTNRNEFSLLVREGRFSSEISWHGHGLQAWMQTMWFLARVDKSSTIVLDEPDVYLHADLQRKLIKVIEGLGFHQSVIATHSSEIIGDVPFQNVTVVQKKERVSRAAENAAQIQSALRGMGSLHSIQLAKVAQSGAVLLVEGEDKAFLSDVAYKLGGRRFDSFSKLAIQEIAGKGNWHLALGAAKSLYEASEGLIASILLLDRDFMTDDEVISFFKKAKQHHLRLKIWKKKEIESYFIVPAAIQRIIARNAEIDVPIDEIEEIITETEQEVREDLILSFADVLQKCATKRIEPKTAFQRAKSLVDEKIRSGFKIRDLASGKDMISGISRRSQERFGVCFSALSLCKETHSSELDEELKFFVMAVTEPAGLSLESFEDCSRTLVAA